jgi:hypothetical protein
MTPAMERTIEWTIHNLITSRRKRGPGKKEGMGVSIYVIYEDSMRYRHDNRMVTRR